jgi:hypothetical protein
MEDDLAIDENLIQSPNHKLAGITEHDLDGLLLTPLKLHQDLSEGCGGQLWPAGMVLLKYMLYRMRHKVQGKTMLVRSFSVTEQGLARMRN